jgi:TRAP transporter 4TM/12TM fusion protein
VALDSAGDLGGAHEPSLPLSRTIVLALSLAWLVFQFYIIANPLEPMVERPIHLVLALALLILSMPLQPGAFPFARFADWALLGLTAATGVYYLVSAERLSARIEAVDPVLTVDVLFGAILLFLLLEGVRRVVGWSLLGLLLIVLFYNSAGSWFPGWLRFRGFELKESIDILTMTTNGVLGITTETSVQFIFYFIVFGAVYGAIGGGKLFIDIGLTVSGRRVGGAAKAAVVSSSLMGTISGSAVANVVSVGVFTIPLMRRAGYSAEAAAAIEAIASTGGQLMPPVMGVAAFVMAEILQVEYAQVAFSAAIPAIAFYVALFFVVHLNARKTGIGTVPAEIVDRKEAIIPRLYLLLPPLILIAMLVAGYSATLAVNIAIVACVATCYLRREGWLSLRQWAAAAEEAGRQSAQVAVPIAAIGMIIAVAIQSNLALKFSTRLIEGGGGNVWGALALTVLGCIIMGMGLPTVAAYIIGAILFVPAIVKLGVTDLAAHMFVMYYCVLSMVTPPVALASYAAAGLAKADTWTTGWRAFQLSFVTFLIPLGFVFDTRLLGQGPVGWVLLGFVSLLCATAAWAAGLVGYLRRPLFMLERCCYAAAAVAIIVFYTGSFGWMVSCLGLAACVTFTMLFGPRKRAATAMGEAGVAAKSSGR